jgi:uncharacterized protein (TIGR02284 family)
MCGRRRLRAASDAAPTWEPNPGIMSNTSNVLDDLIETLKDGQDGFRSASESAPSPELKTILSEYSLQRSKFAGDLQALVRSDSGKEPANSGSVSGALHRGWIGLKAALVKQDAHAILVECERGEEIAVEEYRKAVQTPSVPSHIVDTLKAQLEEVEAAQIRIRALKDRATSR